MLDKGEEANGEFSWMGFGPSQVAIDKWTHEKATR